MTYAQYRLSDFLQVKSVAFINQEGWNKWKTMAVKPSQKEERNIKSPPKSKKLPSLSEHELAREDEEYRKRNSCEVKLVRDNEVNLSLNQGEFYMFIACRTIFYRLC